MNTERIPRCRITPRDYPDPEPGPFAHSLVFHAYPPGHDSDQSFQIEFKTRRDVVKEALGLGGDEDLQGGEEVALYVEGIGEGQDNPFSRRHKACVTVVGREIHLWQVFLETSFFRAEIRINGVFRVREGVTASKVELDVLSGGATIVAARPHSISNEDWPNLAYLWSGAEDPHTRPQISTFAIGHERFQIDVHRMAEILGASTEEAAEVEMLRLQYVDSAVSDEQEGKTERTLWQLIDCRAPVPGEVRDCGFSDLRGFGGGERLSPGRLVDYRMIQLMTAESLGFHVSQSPIGEADKVVYFLNTAKEEDDVTTASVSEVVAPSVMIYFPGDTPTRWTPTYLSVGTTRAKTANGLTTTLTLHSGGDSTLLTDLGFGDGTAVFTWEKSQGDSVVTRIDGTSNLPSTLPLTSTTLASAAESRQLLAYWNIRTGRNATFPSLDTFGWANVRIPATVSFDQRMIDPMTFGLSTDIRVNASDDWRFTLTPIDPENADYLPMTLEVTVRQTNGSPALVNVSLRCSTEHFAIEAITPEFQAHSQPVPTPGIVPATPTPLDSLTGARLVFHSKAKPDKSTGLATKWQAGTFNFTIEEESDGAPALRLFPAIGWAITQPVSPSGMLSPGKDDDDTPLPQPDSAAGTVEIHVAKDDFQITFPKKDPKKERSGAAEEFGGITFRDGDLSTTVAYGTMLGYLETTFTLDTRNGMIRKSDTLHHSNLLREQGAFARVDRAAGEHDTSGRIPQPTYEDLKRLTRDRSSIACSTISKDSPQPLENWHPGATLRDPTDAVVKPNVTLDYAEPITLDDGSRVTRPVVHANFTDDRSSVVTSSDLHVQYPGEAPAHWLSYDVTAKSLFEEPPVLRIESAAGSGQFQPLIAESRTREEFRYLDSESCVREWVNMKGRLRLSRLWALDSKGVRVPLFELTCALPLLEETADQPHSVALFCNGMKFTGQTAGDNGISVHTLVPVLRDDFPTLGDVGDWKVHASELLPEEIDNPPLPDAQCCWPRLCRGVPLIPLQLTSLTLKEEQTRNEVVITVSELTFSAVLPNPREVARREDTELPTEAYAAAMANRTVDIAVEPDAINPISLDEHSRFWWSFDVEVADSEAVGSVVTSDGLATLQGSLRIVQDERTNEDVIELSGLTGNVCLFGQLWKVDLDVALRSQVVTPLVDYRFEGAGRQTRLDIPSNTKKLPEQTIEVTLTQSEEDRGTREVAQADRNGSQTISLRSPRSMSIKATVTHAYDDKNAFVRSTKLMLTSDTFEAEAQQQLVKGPYRGFVYGGDGDEYAGAILAWTETMGTDTYLFGHVISQEQFDDSAVVAVTFQAGGKQERDAPQLDTTWKGIGESLEFRTIDQDGVKLTSTVRSYYLALDPVENWTAGSRLLISSQRFPGDSPRPSEDGSTPGTRIAGTLRIETSEGVQFHGTIRLDEFDDAKLGQPQQFLVQPHVFDAYVAKAASNDDLGNRDVLFPDGRCINAVPAIVETSVLEPPNFLTWVPDDDGAWRLRVVLPDGLHVSRCLDGDLGKPFAPPAEVSPQLWHCQSEGQRLAVDPYVMERLVLPLKLALPGEDASAIYYGAPLCYGREGAFAADLPVMISADFDGSGVDLATENLFVLSRAEPGRVLANQTMVVSPGPSDSSTGYRELLRQARWDGPAIVRRRSYVSGTGSTSFRFVVAAVVGDDTPGPEKDDRWELPDDSTTRVLDARILPSRKLRSLSLDSETVVASSDWWTPGTLLAPSDRNVRKCRFSRVQASGRKDSGRLGVVIAESRAFEGRSVTFPLLSADLLQVRATARRQDDDNAPRPYLPQDIELAFGRNVPGGTIDHVLQTVEVLEDGRQAISAPTGFALREPPLLATENTASVRFETPPRFEPIPDLFPLHRLEAEWAITSTSLAFDPDTLVAPVEGKIFEVDDHGEITVVGNTSQKLFALISLVDFRTVESPKYATEGQPKRRLPNQTIHFGLIRKNSGGQTRAIPTLVLVTKVCALNVMTTAAGGQDSLIPYVRIFRNDGEMCEEPLEDVFDFAHAVPRDGLYYVMATANEHMTGKDIRDLDVVWKKVDGTCYSPWHPTGLEVGDGDTSSRIPARNLGSSVSGLISSLVIRNVAWNGGHAPSLTAERNIVTLDGVSPATIEFSLSEAGDHWVAVWKMNYSETSQFPWESGGGDSELHVITSLPSCQIIGDARQLPKNQETRAGHVLHWKRRL